MGGQPTPRAVLFDCLGTLVRLEPPAPRLRAALLARAGVEVTVEAARAAMRAEVAFYRAHLDEAVDARTLARLRDRCAAVVQDALPALAPVDPAVVRAALLDAVVFTPFDDVVPALCALRVAGIRLVVVSNWDVSLHEVLARTGLDVLLDGAISSAEVGAAKPHPVPVQRGLELASAAAADAWLVGDTPEADVEGARAAGVRPVLIDRDGVLAVPGVQTLASLAELPGLIS